MIFTFQRAVKAQEKARIALDGVTGGGKTWTALTLGTFFADKEGGRIAVIDSERSSAKKYASDFDFDHLTLPDSSPHTYIAAINAAIEGEYSVIIIDSLSHAWEGTLDLKDSVSKRSRSGNSFDAWREVTPVHNQLIDTMLRAPAHIIATMRTKTEYLVEKDEHTGKSSISKVGLRPMQREGVEYEFDIVGDLDTENTLVISKTRCSALNGAVVRKPGNELARTIWDWLNDGEPVVTKEQASLVVEAFTVFDSERRTDVKKAFIEIFGRPNELVISRLDEAMTWIEAQHAATITPPITPPEPLAADGGDFDGEDTF